MTDNMQGARQATAADATQHLTEAEKEALVKSTRRFDLRRIMGGLFLVYGVIVTIVGIVNFTSDQQKADGVAINLWTGIGMLLLAAFFFIWDRLSPVPEEDIVQNLEHEGEAKEIGEGKI